jgi:hypothetical protein
MGTARTYKSTAAKTKICKGKYENSQIVEYLLGGTHFRKHFDLFSLRENIVLTVVRNVTVFYSIHNGDKYLVYLVGKSYISTLLKYFLHKSRYWLTIKLLQTKIPHLSNSIKREQVLPTIN